jgi:hypothetical protein
MFKLNISFQQQSQQKLINKIVFVDIMEISKTNQMSSCEISFIPVILYIKNFKVSS